MKIESWAFCNNLFLNGSHAGIQIRSRNLSNLSPLLREHSEICTLMSAWGSLQSTLCTASRNPWWKLSWLISWCHRSCISSSSWGVLVEIWAGATKISGEINACFWKLTLLSSLPWETSWSRREGTSASTSSELGRNCNRKRWRDSLSCYLSRFWYTKQREFNIVNINL